jgi:hypothetical protein
MSYSSIVEMVNSTSLRGRIMACVAERGIDNPEAWTASNLWKICSEIGASDWDYATDTYNINQNPDTGARVDVVSDAKILTAVEAVEALP